MGIFSKKPPCPICGGKVSRFLPTKVEGEYICDECSGKLDMDDDIRSGLTMQGLREYLAFYEENQSLRSSFVISEKVDLGVFDTKLIFDLEHRLFCLNSKPDKTIFEGCALKSFSITEDNAPLLEGSAQGLIRHVSMVPERVAAMGPQIQMMATAKRMADQAARMQNDDNRTQYRPHIDIPEPFREFCVKLQLDHPYWTTVQSDMSAPTFNNDYPNISGYLDEYQRDVKVMERLAELLMQVAFPDVGEKSDALTAASASEAHIADDIVKYKNLMDAGVITQAEFEAKKKQLLGI